MPSPSPDLLLSLFASPPWAYILSSSVNHSPWLPPHIQLLFGSLRPISCAHRTWESRPPERLPSLSSPAQMKGDNHVFEEYHSTTTRFILYFLEDR
jgi:hypothetical protein